MQMCVHLDEDVLILMERLGVSGPTHICVEVIGITKSSWLEVVGTS